MDYRIIFKNTEKYLKKRAIPREAGTFAVGFRNHPIIKIYNRYISEIIILHGQKDDVEGLLFFSKELLISGCWDHSIKIWNLKERKLQLNILNAHSKSIDALCKISDRLLGSGSDDGTISIWDIMDGTNIRTWGEPTSSRIGAMHYIPSKHYLITGSKNLYVWDLDGNMIFHHTNNNSINCMIVKEDFMVSPTLYLRLNEPFQAEKLVLEKNIRCIEQINENYYMFGSESLGELLLFNLTNKTIQETFKLPDTSTIRKIINVGHETVISVCFDGKIILFSYSSNNYRIIKTERHPIISFARFIYQ